MIDWDDPAARARLIESIGVEAYNKAFDAYRRESIVATVNGYSIAPVNTRFGRLYAVQGTKKAFSTLAEAEAFAQTQPAK
jgi:hypothetical protein